MKDSILNAPALLSLSWKKPLCGHIDASQEAVGGTLTQLDDDGNERIIAYYSKKLSDAEKNYTANDRELLGPISFLQRFRCYLEGSDFEMFTDNQVLKHLFTKPKLKRREARCLETLGNFDIFDINLKPTKFHVLGDVPSRLPHFINSNGHSSAIINVIKIERDYIIHGFENDKFLGLLLKGFREKFPSD